MRKLLNLFKPENAGIMIDLVGHTAEFVRASGTDAKLGKVKSLLESGDIDKAKKAIMDGNTFEDEVRFDAAYPGMNPEDNPEDTTLKDQLDSMLYSLATGDRGEKELHRNFILFVATAKKARRSDILKECAALNDVEELKRVILARGWDKPDKEEVKALASVWDAMQRGARKVGDKGGSIAETIGDELEKSQFVERGKKLFDRWEAKYKAMHPELEDETQTVEED